jgi:hypothetical protein
VFFFHARATSTLLSDTIEVDLFVEQFAPSSSNGLTMDAQQIGNPLLFATSKLKRFHTGE